MGGEVDVNIMFTHHGVPDPLLNSSHSISLKPQKMAVVMIPILHGRGTLRLREGESLAQHHTAWSNRHQV